MRTPNWEARMHHVIEETRARPYVLGESDCFRFACDIESALRNTRNKWSDWRGKYKTKEEALALLNERGGYLRAWSWFFNSKPEPIVNARRGDICVYRDDTGMAHLVICAGPEALGYFDHGLGKLPMSACLTVWRID